MSDSQFYLRNIPSVDELIRSVEGQAWLQKYPKSTVIKAIRACFAQKRTEILEGRALEFSRETLLTEIEALLTASDAYRLKPLVNATGVIIHTNLGRSILSESALRHAVNTSSSYSNLEYELQEGKRGKRYAIIRQTLNELTGAEDCFVVNNNAAAVLLCLTVCAKDREVVISRGELIEIGGSFRMPDVMSASGAILREVGTTNKTRVSDYEQAINGKTGLLLKVHPSNYRIEGFTASATIEELVALGEKYNLPVMFDVGSGCLIDLAPYGFPDEPTIQNIVLTGVEMTTFSGDKLLGGPQAGLIVGKRNFIRKIREHPLARALRIDKMTLAALEATLMLYRDEKTAIQQIPTLKMLLAPVEFIQARANALAEAIQKEPCQLIVSVKQDSARAGGGALPERALSTFIVTVQHPRLSCQLLVELLRNANPPIIGRIHDNKLCLDVRTIDDSEIETIASCLQKISFL